ncbi:MAG: hypothetical protein HOY79_51515 [Streptomyces sp.]|nr:hypothetical protein [Streptomyces sp.]
MASATGTGGDQLDHSRRYARSNNSSSSRNAWISDAPLHAYLRRRNANALHRDVLAAERKERARIRSEKGIRRGGRPLRTAA